MLLCYYLPFVGMGIPGGTLIGVNSLKWAGLEDDHLILGLNLDLMASFHGLTKICCIASIIIELVLLHF